MTRLRTLGVSVGTLAMIAAAAAFRIALGDDELPITEGIVFLAGLGVAFGCILGVPGWRPASATPGGPDLWDRTGAWIAERGALGALLALTILIAVIHANVFRGEPYGDDLTFHMAESKRIADCLRIGDFDFWNPSANAGYASAYYYQVVPQLASAIPSAIFGHHLFWFQLSIFLPIVLAPAAAYRGMRLLGATPWQAAVAAMCACLMNGESRWGSGNAGTFQVGLYTQTWALAAFPLALGHGVRWVRDNKGLAPAIAWGTFVGLCHPFAGIALGLALFAGMLVGIGDLLVINPRSQVAAITQMAIGGLLVALGILLELVEVMTDFEFGPFDALRDPLNPSLYFMPLLPMLAGVSWLYRGWQRRAALPPEPMPIAIADRDHRFRRIAGHFARLAALGALLAIATVPGWITLLVDYKGFGGFPHRVNDEVGPGLVGLLVGRSNPSFAGYFQGQVLDFGFGAHLLTWGMPIVLIFARDKILRWLWAPALAFATLLALGPHLGTTQDDLFPMVRFLGAFQIVLALATGAGVITIGKWLCAQAEDSALIRRLERLLFDAVRPQQLTYAVRTVVASMAAAGTVLLVAGGTTSLGARVDVLERDNTARIQMMQIISKMQKMPQGRKMVGPGCENHWWNLLSYIYSGRPSLLQMGGGGLQASPNYDFLWTEHEWKKTAWLYDAPYLVIAKDKADKIPEGEVVFETTDYEVKKLPASRIISPVTVTGVLPTAHKAAHTAAIAWIKSDAPLADQVLDYDEGPTTLGTALGRTLHAHEQQSPGDEPDIVAEVDAMQPTTFMARESWHPRWHAYIDGEEVPIRRVTPDFPAIDVPTGHHMLAFRFERPWWATASWLAWPGVVLMAWWWSRRRDRSGSPPPETASSTTPA